MKLCLTSLTVKVGFVTFLMTQAGMSLSPTLKIHLNFLFGSTLGSFQKLSIAIINILRIFFGSGSALACPPSLINSRTERKTPTVPLFYVLVLKRCTRVGDHEIDSDELDCLSWLQEDLSVHNVSVDKIGRGSGAIQDHLEVHQTKP